MTPKNPGFIDSAPLKSGALSDFYGGKRELETALECADALWDHHGGNNEGLRSLEGAIHALWFAQNRKALHFEQFLYAYLAIDACWKAASMWHGISAGNHPKRIEKMISHFGLSDPNWSSMTKIRSDLMHEALVSNGSRRLPLGLSLIQNPDDPESNLPQEMCSFASRIIVALLNLPAQKYIASAPSGMVTDLLD